VNVCRIAENKNNLRTEKRKQSLFYTQLQLQSSTILAYIKLLYSAPTAMIGVLNKEKAIGL